MKLSNAIQEALLVLLCYDQKNALIASSLVPPHLFSPIFSEVAQEAVDHRERFGQVPGEHTVDIFEALAGRNEGNVEVYKDLFESVQGSQAGIDPTFVLEKAGVFARWQTMKRGIRNALEALKRDDEGGVIEAESVLSKSLDIVAPIMDTGIDFPHEVDGILDELLSEDDAAFPTGVTELDRLGLGPARGRLHCLMGLPKAGKSLWLLQLAKEAYKHGLSVVYVTLELSKNELLKRHLQSFFGISKRNEDVSYVRFMETDDPDDRGSQRDVVTFRPKMSFQHADVASYLRGKLKLHALGTPPIIVRKFPSGHLTLRELEAFLDLVEQRRGIIPDLLLVDYADLMTPIKNEEYRVSLTLLYRGLKAIADSRNIAVATVSQLAARAKRKRVAEIDDFSESFGKFAEIDIGLTYNQTEAESVYGLARLYVAAARTDRQHDQILISQAYALGQFVKDSVMLGRHYFNSLEQGHGEEDPDFD